MAEVASAYVSLIPSFRGGTGTIAKELSGPASAAGKEAGTKAGEGFKGRFTGALRGIMAPLAGIFAGVQIGRFFGDAVTEASGLRESINALNVSYGDASEGVQALGKNAAESLGLSNLEFNNLAVRFSSFSKTIAGDGGDVVGTLEDLTGRASDFASVMNLDVAEAARLFQSGLAGESEPLRQFGIDMSAAAVTAYALENGIASSASSMTEAEKVQARYGLIMEQTAQTQGDFANTSDELANKQRILGANFDDFKAAIGEKLLPVMSNFVTFLTDDALPGVEDLAEGAEDFVAKVTEWKTPILIITGTITAVFLPALIAIGVQHTIAAAKAVVAWAVMQASAIAGAAAQSLAVLRVVGGWILMGAQALLQAGRMALAWFIAMGPVGWVIAIIIGLTILIIANWDKIVAWTKKAWTNVTAFLSKSWSNIKQTATNVWNAILSFFRGIPGKIVQFFMNFTLPGLMIKHWDSIKTGAVRGWDAVVSFIKGVPGKIVSALGSLGSLLVGAGRSILDGLLGGLREGFEAVKNFVGGIGSWIAENKGPKAYDLALLRPAGGWIMEGLERGIEESIPSLQRTLGEVSSSISVRSNLDDLRATGAAIGSAAGLPGSIALLDADGSILTRARVIARGTVADNTRAHALAGRPR